MMTLEERIEAIKNNTRGWRFDANTKWTEEMVETYEKMLGCKSKNYGKPIECPKQPMYY